ncbi:Hypothetical predicted protein, partial [Paramuricea clavata]
MLELQIVVPYRMHWSFQNYVRIILLKHSTIDWTCPGCEINFLSDSLFDETQTQSENCMDHVVNILTKLGYSEDFCRNQIEIAHRTGRKISNRPRHIILKFFSRPLKNEVLRLAKWNKSILNGIYFLDDLTKEDFDLKQRVRPLMAAAYKEGSKVTFRA